MSAHFGNLSVDQIERRSGVQFPQELKDYMYETHQNAASNIRAGMWHCFDIPFKIVCGDVATAKKIHNYLAPLSSSFVEPLQIVYQ